MWNPHARAKQRSAPKTPEPEAELSPFKPGTKQLADGWYYGRGDKKGLIIHSDTGTELPKP